jgi:hypothetical protein
MLTAALFELPGELNQWESDGITDALQLQHIHPPLALLVFTDAGLRNA